jgi:multidrug efflux pump subunit AcrA (membrane-fusion protein)
LLKQWVCIIFLSCLLVSAAGCAGRGQNDPTPTPFPQVVSAQKITFKVERGPIISQRDVAGEIVPAQQDELFFRSSGFINRVLVKTGEFVKKGDILAELKLDDLLDQLQQARIDLEVSQQSLALQQVQRAYDAQQAEADVVISQKQVELARSRLEQAQASQRVEAQLNLEIAQERYKTAAAGLALVKAKIGAEVGQIVKRNQLSLDRLQRLVEERQMIAPYDGIVLRIGLIPGTQATAFSVAAVIGDPTHLVVRVSYDYELVNTVDTSTEAYLFPTKEEEPKYPVKFIPNFLPISNKQEGLTTKGSDITVNFLYFAIPEGLPADQIPVGSRVNLRIILGSKDNVLLLPPPAIRGNDTFSYVIVLEDDYHRRVEVVAIGVKTIEKWEIIANLKEGDLVLGP